MNNESSKLLKECASGCKMAIDSINNILPRVENNDLRKYLESKLIQHNEYLFDCNNSLFKSGEDSAEPNYMARICSEMTTKMKLKSEDKESKIPTLIIEGANMGIQKITEYKEGFSNASFEANQLAERLIKLEQDFKDGITRFV